jgi:septum site-determining protein MinD
VSGRAIAIVSGKGGSGKTILAAEMAVHFARAVHPLRVILVDADTGTGGLSLYLGVNEIRRDLRGLSTIILNSEQDVRAVEVDDSLLRPLRNYRPGKNGLTSEIRMLPVGDFRSVNREFQRTWTDSGGTANARRAAVLAPILADVVSELRNRAEIVIVDCRGGIDDESIAVCQAVDDIFLVAETDTTAFQASLDLLDVLADGKLGDKLRGFVFNKVFSDPSLIERSAGGNFDLDLLATIPFDLSSARAFLVGDIPETSSIFGTHVQEALSKIYPALVPEPAGRVWRSKDFEEANVFTPTALRASVIAAFVILSVGLASAISVATGGLASRVDVVAIVIVLAILGAVSVSLVPFLLRRGSRVVR